MMKIKTSLVLVGCLSLIVCLTSISLTACDGPPSHAASWQNAAVAKYSVVNPRGASTVEPIIQVPRLDTLEGKTICLMAIGAFRTDETMPVLEAALEEQYPSATVVPYTEFPLYVPSNLYYPGDYRDAVPEAILNKGCDAVIAGNGG